MARRRLCAYRTGYKHQLAQSYRDQVRLRPKETIHTPWIQLYSTGVLTINRGYAWNGATGAVNTKTFICASLVHDALYQLIRLGLLEPSARRAADRELRRIAREDGMGRFRAAYVYAAVRLFGTRAVTPAKEPAVLIAP